MPQELRLGGNRAGREIGTWTKADLKTEITKS
jgi:hypothetical protein